MADPEREAAIVTDVIARRGPLDPRLGPRGVSPGEELRLTELARRIVKLEAVIGGALHDAEGAVELGSLRGFALGAVQSVIGTLQAVEAVGCGRGRRRAAGTESRPTYRGNRVHFEPSDPHGSTPCGLEDWWEYRCAPDLALVTCRRCLAAIGTGGGA